MPARRAAFLSAFVLACALGACSSPKPDDHGWWVIASNETGGSLSVIDGQSEKLVRTIAVGKRPRGVQPAADGRSVWVALSGWPIGGPHVDESKLPPPDRTADALERVEIPSGRILQRFGGVSNPEQLGISSSRLFVASEDNSTADGFDAHSGRLVLRKSVGSEPEGIAVSPDGGTLLISTEGDHKLVIMDAATGAIQAQVDVGERPRGIAFSPDGRLAYVTCEVGNSVAVIDVAQRRLLRQYAFGQTGWLPMGIVAAPDGNTLYVAMGRGGVVAELSSTTLKPLRIARVGTRPWGIRLSPDGTRLYVANGPSNDVSVIDAQSFKVTATIPVADRPWGVAILPKRG